jgi:hypothetical protein
MARSGILYGSSGSYKTTAVKHFARYIYEVTGKRTNLLSMDGGGWDACVPEVLAGIISPYRVTMVNPLPVLRVISTGYWPESDDPEVPMNLIPVNWNEVGGIAIEGLTSISQAEMRYLADNGMVVGGEKTSLGRFDQGVRVNGVVKNEAFAGSSMGHYGFTQNNVYSFVMNLGALVGPHYVLFTALESRTEEDDRSTTYGPQISGKKATALAPAWVGDCLHFQDYGVPRIVKVPDPQNPKELIDSTIVETMVRAHFMKHPDPVTGIMFPAKPRITPEKVADLMKAFPGGYFTPSVEHGFDTYLHKIDELQRGQGDEAKAWRQKIDEKFGRGKLPQPIREISPIDGKKG